MDEAGRPSTLTAWIECESCGRIDKPAHDFNYPADMAADVQLFVWMPTLTSRPLAPRVSTMLLCV
jgi:hypothetical protein